MAERAPGLLITCEHGGNRVPLAWSPLFRGSRALLDSHRGWDPGALVLARELARRFDAPIHAATTTRLLVDLNRSEHHRALLSRITRRLGPEEREVILARHYRPHRAAVERELRALLARHGSVVHVAVHSFAPVLGGKVRRADIGLLYDPRRPFEAAIARAWKAALLARDPRRIVRANYPYRGISDGLTTSMRRNLGARYAGLELELNQRLPLGPIAPWRRLRGVIGATLAQILHRP